MRVPQGVSAADFSAALDQFRNIVGGDHVWSSDEDLDLYRDAYSIFWGEPEERYAGGAVAPASVEEVQAIVRVANTYGVPLYPISTGRNLGYGGSAPNLSGSVVLDLKRMNRIVDINPRLRTFVVEPGASFFDVHRELRSQGLRLMVSQPAPGWGSPIGNALDHGIGNPAGDHFANHCGMEVVLPTGDLVRTGMGALPSDNAKLTWSTYHYGCGPFIDGIFSQSNFGIVTKMGFNLFDYPESTRSLSIAISDYDSVEPLLERLAALEQVGLVPVGGNLFSPLHNHPDQDIRAFLALPGDPPASAWNQLARDKGLPIFTSGVNFSGPEKVTAVQLEVVHERLADIPGLTLTARGPTFSPSDKEIAEGATAPGTPGLQAFWRDTAQFGWDGHLWFSPIMARTGEEIKRANALYRQACVELDFYWGMPDMIGPFPKTIFVIRNFSVSKSSAVENAKTREVFMKLLRIAADNGWSEYRAAPAFQQAIMDQFSFNDHALMRTLETIKDALDPNGIVAAGRYGIWPRHLRGTRSNA